MTQEETPKTHVVYKYRYYKFEIAIPLNSSIFLSHFFDSDLDVYNTKQVDFLLGHNARCLGLYHHAEMRESKK